MIKGVYKNIETDLDKKLLKTEFLTATAVFIRVTKICCLRVKVSAYEPEGSSGRRLSPVSVA